MKVASWKTIQTNGCLQSAIESTKENSKQQQSRNGGGRVMEEMVGLTFAKDDSLLITRPRQISIVEDSNETVLHSSKTGKATSFSIPAVRCADHCIFALQSGNQQLVCFKNNNKKTVSATLESPAIQLAVLRGSTVVGVCRNGRIFWAFHSMSSLKVQYLGDANKRPMTVACPLSHHRRPTKRKRDGRTVMVEQAGVCFLRQHGNGVELVSYTWGESLAEDSVEVETQELVGGVIPVDLKGVTLLGSLNDDVVCAKYGDSVFSFSRTNGRVASRALVLPSAARSVCLVGCGNMAYLMGDNIMLLVDVRRDLVVAREVMEPTNGRAEVILTDVRDNRLAVISKVSSKITSIASAVFSDEGDQLTVTTTLASALESSMALEPIRMRKRTDKHCAVTDAVREFESACDNALAGNAAAKKENYLLESFNAMVEKAKRVHNDGTSQAKNGEHHNENGTNGHVNGGKKEPSIPPQVVGPSTIAVMRLWSRSSIPKNDCRFILRRLIRSGYASARNHLLFPDLFHHTENKSNKVKDASCYLPLELMYDVLDHCTDVSEGIVVLSLKFLISRMSDEDIMSYYRKSKRKCLGTIDMTASDESTIKLRLFATIDLFAKILDYSPCNDGILRNTLSSLLTSAEVSILLKTLVEFRRPTGSHAPGIRLTQNHIVWLTCLLDVANERNVDNAKNLRHTVLFWTRSELSTSQQMIALSATLQQCLAVATKMDDHQIRSKDLTSVAAAGYQIERVQF